MKKQLAFFGLLLMSCMAHSQVAATNTGTLYISTSSDIFYTASDFTNTSTLLTNNGQLYVKGTLTNNQTPATVGTGTLYLNGSSAQSVAGSAMFKTYNLNTNNAAGFTLNNNLSVSGTHTFVAGKIASSTTPNYLIYEGTGSHTGSSDAAHVTGWVKKYGTTAFTFPTGNGTYLRDIAISNLSASMEIDAKYMGATPNIANMQAPLSSMNPNEYWALNNITAGTTTAQVTLNWNNPKVAFPNYVVPDIRSAQYDLNTSKWTSTGGSATGTTATTGSITSTALNVFGSLSIGSISFLVPLNFLNVTAERKPNFTQVEWKTVNEVNVKQHEVQRSNSSTAFATIGTVPAHNSLIANTYTFSDADILSGKIYYRIKSVDFDGKIKYSKVVSVSYDPLSETIAIKNNPVKTVINLSLSSRKKTAFTYQLFAANGSSAQQGKIQYGGSGSMAIPLQSYTKKGTYVLSLNDGKNLFSQKIVVD